MWSPICHQCWLGKYWLSLTPKITSCWLSSCDDGADWLIFANYARGYPTNNNLDQTIWNGRLQQIRGFSHLEETNIKTKFLIILMKKEIFCVPFSQSLSEWNLGWSWRRPAWHKSLDELLHLPFWFFLQSFRLMISINTFLFTKFFLVG